MKKVNHKFGERLRQLRKERGISAEELAKIMEVNKSTISRYETGKRDPFMPFVQKIALFFNVSIDWLVGTSEIRDPSVSTNTLSKIFNSLPDPGKIELVNYAKYLHQRYSNKSKNSDNKNNCNNIKILGSTAAGQPIEYCDDSFIEEADVKNIPKGADFALTVKGDSMEPLIKDGSLVWIKSQPDVENGEIAVIEIDGAVTCKKVYKHNGKLELRSINPKYKPIILDHGNVRILGKVILD
ncbi:MAG: helix-turn-helix domain-containing protein [Thermoanaerobacteraceae bacterium]|nr:helix-turn-helix domain-containing protein [Thermoanaerobacteraceae bacterium]